MGEGLGECRCRRPAADQGFFDRSATIRWLLGIFFVCGLALFFQLREPTLFTSDSAVSTDSMITAEGTSSQPDSPPALQQTNELNALEERKTKEDLGSGLARSTSWTGSIILSLLLAGVSTAYLRFHQSGVYYSNRLLSLSLLICLLGLLLAKGAEYVLLQSRTHLDEIVQIPILVPFAAILTCSLLNRRLAVYVSILLTVTMASALVVGVVEFLIVNFVTSLVAVFTMQTFRRRKEVFTVCGWAWLAALAAVVGLHASGGSLLDWAVVADLFSALLFLVLTAVLVVGLQPLLESLFRVVTEVALMELMDPSHPLLRRLSIEAPGTYQHSIIVGNLAEAAAMAIGANGLLCRAAALYHDVGKIVSPQWFVENQAPEELDVHRVLTPQESAEAIMAHVPEGVALARRHGLPEAIIDAIKEHHGTTLVYYFYHQAHAMAEREGTLVDEADFRYEGPKPRRREAAIIMIADAAEAAGRSLDDMTEERLTELVNRLAREKAEDGQFDECEITFEELALVKHAVIRSLVVAAHARVKYPARRPVGEEVWQGSV
jgi:cyclic-di-AMP phosphodiesterase PgpH